MSVQTNGFTRRQFLRGLAASLASSSACVESVLADEPVSDQLGQALPRRLLGRTGEKVTMLGLGGFPVGSLNDSKTQALIEAAIEGGIRGFCKWEQKQRGSLQAHSRSI